MAGSNPWSKFFWQDWEADPALRLCSLAAQGLWMRCLCIAAKSDPIGYVTINGRPLDATDLARLTGEAESSVRTLLSELDRGGVFSRDSKDRIYSRRMLRDHKKAKTARQNGKLGGNPSIGKQRGFSPSDNPVVKGVDKPQSPEAISQSPEREKKRAKKATRIPVNATVSEEWKQRAREQGLSFDQAELEAKKFVDHWLGISGAKGVKCDWQATWRNWIRRSLEYSQKGGQKTKQERIADDLERFKRKAQKKYGSG